MDIHKEKIKLSKELVELLTPYCSFDFTNQHHSVIAHIEATVVGFLYGKLSFGDFIKFSVHVDSEPQQPDRGFSLSLTITFQENTLFERINIWILKDKVLAQPLMHDPVEAYDRAMSIL